MKTNELEKRLMWMDISEEETDNLDTFFKEQQMKYDLLDRLVLTMIVWLILSLIIITYLFTK